MVYAEGGIFMKSAVPEQGDDTKDNERPAHLVTVLSFSF